MSNFLNYEISIGKMTCSNCSNSILKALEELEFVKKASINLMFNKLYLTVSSEDELEEVKYTIEEMKYTVNSILPILAKDSKQRLIYLRSNESDKIFSTLDKHLGIADVKISDSEKTESQDERLVSIFYEPKLLKAHEIKKLLDDKLINYTYTNSLAQKMSHIENVKEQFSTKDFILCGVITAIIFSLNMILSGGKIEEFLVSIWLFTPGLNLHLLICFSLTVVLIVKYGFDIYRKAFVSFYKNYSTGMESLITLGSLSSLLMALIYFISLLVAPSDEQTDLSLDVTESFGTAALVIGISCLGKFVEEKAKLGIRNKSAGLVYSDEVNFKDQKYTKVTVTNRKFKYKDEIVLDSGLFEEEDTILLKENQCLLVDSVLLSGEVEINEKINQGYSSFTRKCVGEKIRSGSIISSIDNSKPCIVAVEAVLDESKFYKLIEAMIESMNQKLEFQHFIDKITKYFVPAVVFISVLTFLIWTLIMIFSETTTITIMFIAKRSISILVISCPCAFGLAIPTVTSIAISKAVKHGILLRNLNILPEIKNTKIAIFDKTGTLTEQLKKVDLIYNNENFPVTEVVQTMESKQSHPIAEALNNYCSKANRMKNTEKYVEIRKNALREENNMSSINTTTSFESSLIFDKTDESEFGMTIYSSGIEANVEVFDSKKNTSISSIYKVLIGNERLFKQKNISINSEVNNIVVKAKEVSSIILVAFNEEIVAVFSADTTTNLRNEAKELIPYLEKEFNIKSVILSGDQEEMVKDAGRELNIDPERVYGGKTPEEKRAIINHYKDTVGDVMMVGDGVNDSLSLVESNYGISFNPNSQLNMISGIVVIVKEDLSLIISLLKISKFTFILIWANIFWAFAYNVFMIPLSTGFLSSIININISPQLSSFFMLLSSLLIIFNSSLLIFVKLDSFKTQSSLLRTRSEIELGSFEQNRSSEYIQFA